MNIKGFIVAVMMIVLSSNVFAQLTYKRASSLYHVKKYNESIELCKSLPKDGKTFYLLACCYLKLGNFEEYVRNLSESAKKNFCYAQVEMGRLYCVGENGFSVDFAEAKYWLNKAVENNEEKKDDYMLSAFKFLGNIYYTENKLAEAHNLWERGAKEGSGFLQCWLGQAYVGGKYGYSKNLEKAKYWYGMVVQSNRSEEKADALNALGTIYLNEENKAEAIKCWQQAIQYGDSTYAPYNLAFHHFEAINDNERAFSLYRIAAENSQPDAQFAVGRFYKDGIVVNKNQKEAMRWFQRSADQGNSYAVSELGAGYEVLYRSSLDERYLRLALKYLYKNSKNEFVRFRAKAKNEDGQTTYEAEDPLKVFYEEGVLGATKYKSFEEWKENVVAKIAVDSDVNVNIPQNAITNTGIYVLIIANEIYEYEQYVPYAENDGNVFAKYCEYVLGIPEKNVHIVINSGLNKMKVELDWLNQMAGMPKTKKVIFYYVGHGVPDDNQTTSYLLPVDGLAKNTTTGLNVDEVYKTLGTHGSKAIILLDACFSGARRDGGMLVASRGVAIKAKDAQPQGNMTVISACQGDETAYPYTDQQHGLFTYFLLKGLKESNGNMNLGQLYDFVKDNVKNTSITINQKAQTPSVISSQDATEWRSERLK